MNDKISIDQVEEALGRSGYLLESRLEKVLRENGFYVEANSSYLDSETGKSRELDLFAMNGYGIGSNEVEYIFSVLLIEAVNNPQPIAFITKESQISPLHREDILVAGLPIKIPDKASRNGWVFLPEYLAMNEYHHYCQGHVATQYCSFMQKKNDLKKKEWMAFHDEVHFNSFRTLCVAVEYFKDALYRGWTIGNSETINMEFYYPVVVVQGELLEVQPGEGCINIQPTDHIQYRRTSIVGTREISYQIDVVTELYVPNLLSIIRAELEHTVGLLDKVHTKVHAAISKIIEQAKRANNYEEIRAAFDFISPLKK